MASLTFHGGVNEIGGNKVLLEDGDSRVFLDFGKSFTKWGNYYEEFLTPRSNNGLRDLLTLGIVPTVDGIYRSDFLKAPGFDNLTKKFGNSAKELWAAKVLSYQEVLERLGRPFIDGVLVTHAHEDHFKHISFLDPSIRIFSSPITKTLIQVGQDLGRGGFEDEIVIPEILKLGVSGARSTFPGEPNLDSDKTERVFTELSENQKVGSFEIKGLQVDHSVPGALAFYITTSSGRSILYTGDFRFHGSRHEITSSFKRFTENLQPEVLIIEGTRIDREEPDSEANVRDKCIDLIKQTDGLIMVGFSWKDTTRFRTMKEVAAATHRTLVVQPKLAYLLNSLKGISGIDSEETSMGPTKVYLQRKDSMMYSKPDYTRSKYELGYAVIWDKGPRLEHFETGLRAYDIRREPSKYLMHLPYYDFNELVDLAPTKGSIFIAAYSEPFDLEMELEETRAENWFRHFQINPPAYEPIHIHASGHASGPEIKDFISAMKPKRIFTIHTEHPELFVTGLPLGIELINPVEGMKYDI